ncbi:MAG: C25 family cysteine peptidase [Anaerolineae bacterium]|nr:C25 family cysteine peptidase [Anaerolineae bacterium]
MNRTDARHATLIKALIVALGLTLGLGAVLLLSLSTAVPASMAAELGPRHAAAPATTQLAPAMTSSWTPPTPSYRITVQDDGLYALDYDYLDAAGLPVDTIDPATFRLFWMGQEVPIQVTGDGDNAFEPGEAVLFYGRGVDSLFYDGLLPTNKYTGINVFFLTYGGTPGLRMAEKDGSLSGSPAGPFLHTVHIEQNREYFAAYPFEHNADHWVGWWIQATGPTVGYRNYTFSASNIATGSFSGTLTVKMLGFTSGPHHLNLYVNGSDAAHQVLDGSPTWGGYQVFETTVDVSQSLFKNGTNTIRVEIKNIGGKTYDKVYVNWVRVGYYDTYVAEGNVLAFGNDALGPWSYQVTSFGSDQIEVYDVSDMTNVQRFINTTVAGGAVTFGDVGSTSSRYLALTPAAWLAPLGVTRVTYPVSPHTPADLLDTANGADYILISHANFWPQAQRLALYRAPDHRVALIDVQQIYDQFNGGLMSAEAIHDFLQYAYDHWQPPRPAFVLLMGDGTNDMRQYIGNSAPTFIPPYLYLADAILGETACENRFVLLEGDDLVPDMHIGRLPVNDLAQAEAMVDKIINYEAGCTCNGWSNNVLFIADDPAGGGGNFYDFSNEIADGYEDPPTNTIKYLPEPPYTKTKVYLGEPPEGNCSTPTACRYAITTTLNITGALLVNYIGHATKTAWGAEDRLVDEAVLNTLDNGPCLPIFLGMTCYEGFFHEPPLGYSSLGEAATRRPVHGAVASWSPTGFGLTTGHDYLNKGFFLALFHDSVDTVGEATTAGKRYLWDNQPPGKYDDLMDTFILLGDPALKIKMDENCDVPTAVRMAGFTAQAQPDGVWVQWQTASELDMLGFRLLRRQAPDGEFVRLNEEPIFAVWSGRDSGHTYTFLDRQAVPGVTYDYILEIITLDGAAERYGSAQATMRWWLRLPMVVR